ncbi:2-haloalkanoic acid dehalogenase [Prochlorococcus marinus str. MIT 9321]|uniref:2-haloalkanoic acid dehalogenase n=1 Tax=Prochlorococcus marinus str. MIT 9401 TaxID=167551 RepID=A0A0A2BBH9_PROMR|nr:HAD family hydrolase [Prochlorococcus marinus]KGG02845.1 2-haloalkanoic acid dehalogenase [Prochlorococcus marinus str. MIT 9321]KGG05468.1 2-haloalkanoic acid dehalogenase [Prochlorococcus marinus str. MIT 9322]KGG10502.1 2-haloalkanoic acid dehalogenase [Prochlorococcus marinus str. MIT 9401]
MTFNIINKKSFIEIPKAIIFDTDNTLYPYKPSHKVALKAAINKASKILSISESEFKKAYLISREEVKYRLGEVASSHSRLLYFQRAIEILGLQSQILLSLDLEQTYWRTFLQNSELFPNVIELLKILKKQNIKTAIVTDLTAQIQFRKIIYFGLEDYFDYIVTSEESGKDKPFQNSFELVLKKLDIEANKCWMIGDSFNSDMVGSNKLGIVSIHKKERSHFFKKEVSYVDAEFSEFKSLQDFFISNIF